MDEEEIEELAELIGDSYDVVVYKTPGYAVSLTDQQRAMIVERLKADMPRSPPAISMSSGDHP